MMANRPERLPTRVLIIDDEKDIIDVIKNGIFRHGFDSDSFSDPLEAVGHFRNNAGAYCAVLSDIRMPGISGFGVAREIKRINPKVKVILLSSFEILKNEVSKVMPSHQVDDFISKPASISLIHEVLLKQIGHEKRLNS